MVHGRRWIVDNHDKDKGKDGSDQEIFHDKCKNLEKMLEARNVFAYGSQWDYFDHGNCIGWTREGIEEERGSGCAVLSTNGDEGFKKMEVGKRFAGKIFIVYLEQHPAEVNIDGEGWGEFHASPGSVSVWVERK